MLEPSIAELKLRYRERLQEAASCRPFKQAGADSPSLRERVLLNLGTYLISSGQKLKARYQSDSAGPAFEWVSRTES